MASGIGAEGRRARTAVAADAVVPPPLAEARQAVVGQPGPENDHIGKDGVGERHSFTLEYTDSRGRVWRGAFRSHVLTIREKVQVGLLKARLAGNAPPEALDYVTASLLEIMAHLTIALDDAPPWASDLEKIRDPGVLQAIYEEVAGHEARFHGTGGIESGAAPDEGSDNAD